MQNLMLIGMPGAGKSYWAQLVGAASGRNVLDLDAEIERVSGTSVSGIFAAGGEELFRKTEAEVLQKLLTETKPFVLATGGGTPCFSTNLEIMLQAGTVVYLQAPVAVLVQRILAQQVQRPLLAHLPEPALIARLDQLLAERKPYYRQAHHILPVEGLSAATFASL